MPQKEEICAARQGVSSREPSPPAGRRIKIGEGLEVLNYPLQLRGLALELPRSYREKALTH